MTDIPTTREYDACPGCGSAVSANRSGHLVHFECGAWTVAGELQPSLECLAKQTQTLCRRQAALEARLEALENRGLPPGVAVAIDRALNDDGRPVPRK